MWKKIASAALCTVLMSSALESFECNDWLVRTRALWVAPNDSSGSLSSVPHSGVSVSDVWTGEVDFTYMWTDNIGTELILATSKHKLNGKKALDGVDVGSTWVLPPTLSLQYHFFPCEFFQPYVGVGVNYSLFYNKHCSIESTHINLRNSWGVSAQVGFDYVIDDCWFVNFDAKYITMNTKAHLKGAVAGHVHVNINPWVIGFGIGRKF